MLVQINPKKKTIYSSLPMQVFMIHAIKKPLIEGVNTLFSPDAKLKDKIGAIRELWKAFKAFQKMPEPTKENTWHPNSHNLIEIRDEFFKHCFLDEIRRRFIRNIFNFVIILYDFDAPWRMMIDWCVEEWLKKDWKPRWYETALPHNWSWWHEEIDELVK